MSNTTIPLIADRSTMSGGDLIVALAFIAVVAGALHLANPVTPAHQKNEPREVTR